MILQGPKSIKKKRGSDKMPIVYGLTKVDTSDLGCSIPEVHTRYPDGYITEQEYVGILELRNGVRY